MCAKTIKSFNKTSQELQLAIAHDVWGGGIAARDFHRTEGFNLPGETTHTTT
jgi:hypothetical protein